MKLEIIRRQPTPPPIEKVILELSPEEVRYLRYTFIHACQRLGFNGHPAARFLDKTEEFDNVAFKPEECFV